MITKAMLLLGSLTVLAAGCASTSPDYDLYMRQLDMPYWESSQLNGPPRNCTFILPQDKSGLSTHFPRATAL
jgi:hypothetical protein